MPYTTDLAMKNLHNFRENTTRKKPACDCPEIYVYSSSPSRKLIMENVAQSESRFSNKLEKLLVRWENTESTKTGKKANTRWKHNSSNETSIDVYETKTTTK
jgi:hypothetical protein